MADSISVYYGRAYGQNIWNYVNQQAQRSGEEINKEEMLKRHTTGAFQRKTAMTSSLDMRVGMDMKGFIQQTGEDGVKLSKVKRCSTTSSVNSWPTQSHLLMPTTTRSQH